MKLKAVIIILVSVILAGGIIYLSFYINDIQDTNRITEEIINNGINYSNIVIEKDLVTIDVQSTADSIVPEDLFLIPYLQDAIRKTDIGRPILLIVITGNRDIIYTQRFEPNETYDLIVNEPSSPTMTEEMLDTQIAFYTRNLDIYEESSYKLVSGSQCYVLENPEYENTGRIINFSIVTDNENKENVISFFPTLIQLLNEKGAAISQYNLYITDRNGNCLYLAAVNLLGKGTLRLI